MDGETSVVARKQYHPRKQSRGPWAKRENSEYEFGGGADSILDAARWVNLRREGEARHAFLMESDPFYRATYEVTTELHRDMFERPGRLSGLAGMDETFDGGTYITEPFQYPTYGDRLRNGPI